MTDQPNTDPPGPDAADQALYRDVTAVLATVDQHSAEIDALNVIVMVQMFALGALAGLVFLLARNLKDLDALAG
jgi:hypothetical protein